jgi:hypothetical protein
MNITVVPTEENLVFATGSHHMAQREVAIQDPLECSIAKRLLVEET